MSEIEVKACPFCGGKGHISRDHCPDDTGIFYSVKCGSCGAKSGEKYASHGNDCGLLYQEVRDLWNNRPLENNKDTRIANLEAENKRALEPSGSTKYAYSGEFHFFHTVYAYDEYGEYVEEDVEVTVPWTTIKDIMAVIKSRAALSKGGQ